MTETCYCAGDMADAQAKAYKEGMNACKKAYEEFMYKEHPQEAITDFDIWHEAWFAGLKENK